MNEPLMRKREKDKRNRETLLVALIQKTFNRFIDMLNMWHFRNGHQKQKKPYPIYLSKKAKDMANGRNKATIQPRTALKLSGRFATISQSRQSQGLLSFRRERHAPFPASFSPLQASDPESWPLLPRRNLPAQSDEKPDAICRASWK